MAPTGVTVVAFVSPSVIEGPEGKAEEEDMDVERHLALNPPPAGDAGAGYEAGCASPPVGRAAAARVRPTDWGRTAGVH